MVALLVLCVAIFDVPSAYVIANGKPRWFAWALGALAFPVIPVVWNVLGERKRRRAGAGTAKPGTTRKPTTTRWERICLRTAFVGVVVIGGLFGIARGRAWHAVRDHALWFVPTDPGHLDPGSPLLRRVPGTATSVLWLRDTSVSEGLIGQIFPGGAAGSFELVIAFDGEHGYFSERGDIHLVELLAQTSHNPWFTRLGFTPSGVRSLPDGSRTWSTPGWAGGSNPPAALIDQLRAAPGDAFLVGAMRDDRERGTGTAWLAGRDGELEAVVELTAPTEAAAKQLEAEADRTRARGGAQLACWDQSDGSASLVRDGATIRARATIPVAQIRPLFLCVESREVTRDEPTGYPARSASATRLWLAFATMFASPGGSRRRAASRVPTSSASTNPRSPR